MLTFAAPKDTRPPNFAEKTFVNSHKAVKFTKFFSLKSFPLYGMADQPYGYMVCNVPSIPRRILSLGEKEKSGPSD